MILSQMQWELRNYNPYNEYFIPLFLGLLIVITVRLLRPEYFSFLTRSIFNNSNILLFARQDLQTGGLYTASLIFNYILSLTVGIAVFINIYSDYRIGFLDYIYLNVGLLILFYVKYLLLKAISWISEQDSGLQEIRYNLFVFFEMGGVVILTLSFMMLFFQNNQFLFALLIIGFQAFMYLIFIIRGIIIAISQRISFFYIFLYLCTLEILPVVVIFYAFSGEIKGFEEM